jgi:hydroxyacylglutathione hydrolase
VWPGHGAGSACGKALGAVPSSTVGYEKRANWGVAMTDEDAFVAAVLEGQPEPPRYFAEMKRINRDGPPVLGNRRLPAREEPDALLARVDAGAWIVDLRPAPAFAAAHVPGTLSIPLNRSFTTWAGWLLPYDADVYLLTDGVTVGDTVPDAVTDAVRALGSIGLDRVAGWFGEDAFAAWERGGRAIEVTTQVTPEEIAPQLADGTVTVVDVRGASEWSAGHLPGAMHVPLGYLAEQLADLDRSRPLVLQCQSGARSAIATSVLRRLGVQDVRDLVGGFVRWRAEGRPVETGTATVTVET